MKSHKAIIKALSVMLSAFIILCIAPVNSLAAGNSSVYLELASDRNVSSTTTILTTTINLTGTSKVYIQSDGRYFATTSDACANMTLSVDSVYVGSHSLIDWRNRTRSAQHSFNTIAALTLGAGTHTVSLVAIRNSGSFTVGAGSNLCVMTDITVNMQTATMSSDSSTYNFTTYGITPPTAVPHSPLLSVNVNNSSGPIIALGSARAYNTADGDKMLGIYKDGTALPNNEGMWTVNDSYSGCESQAPMYTHAYMNATGNHTISLDASEFPWSTGQGEDPAQYKVGAGTSLVVLNGAMRVSGSASQSTAVNNCWDWHNLGTGNNTPVAIASATINIPSGHNGVVMFEAKTRFQGDNADAGGNGFLWIAIDGVMKGSLGCQQIVQGAGASQRSACASYLSAGTGALSVGNHTVTVYASASGSFLHLCAVNDLPLVWFDGTSI